MESFESLEENEEESEVREIVDELEAQIEDGASFNEDDGTYEVESDSYTLTFTLNENLLEIRSIDVRGNAGLGSIIISILHDYADKYDLSVIASNVKDTARGFWEKMGYQEGEEKDEFFRVE